jgi:hypothetical protein
MRLCNVCNHVPDYVLENLVELLSWIVYIYPRGAKPREQRRGMEYRVWRCHSGCPRLGHCFETHIPERRAPLATILIVGYFFLLSWRQARRV